MRVNAADLPVRLEANGVQILGGEWGGMDIGRLHVPAGGDTTPLLEACGHTVWTDEGFESLQLSPMDEMQRTLDHVRTKLGLTPAIGG